MEGNLWFILKLLPYLGFCSLIAGFVGWHLHSKAVHAPRPAKQESSTSEVQRLKKMQQALQQSEHAQQLLKKELAEAQAAARKASQCDALQADLKQSQASLEAERLQHAALRGEWQKAQEQLATYHGKERSESKEQRERVFVLDNELSQVRAELAQLRAATDDSAQLREELERARESVAQATRFAGELRKREVGLQKELETCQAQLASAARSLMGMPSAVSTPVGDSETVLRARAEVAAIEAKRAAEKAIASQTELQQDE